MEIRHLYNSLLMSESHLYQFEHQTGTPEMLLSQTRSRLTRLRAELEVHPDRFDPRAEKSYLCKQVLEHLRRTAVSKGACNTCAHYQWNILVRNADTDDSLDKAAETWLNMPGNKVVCSKTKLLRSQPLKDLCLEYAPDKDGMVGNAHHGVIVDNGRVKEAEAWRALYEKYRV